MTFDLVFPDGAAGFTGFEHANRELSAARAEGEAGQGRHGAELAADGACALPNFGGRRPVPGRDRGAAGRFGLNGRAQDPSTHGVGMSRQELRPIR